MTEVLSRIAVSFYLALFIFYLIGTVGFPSCIVMVKMVCNQSGLYCDLSTLYILPYIRPTSRRQFSKNFKVSIIEVE